ncbi:hypothetical protein SAMN05192534_12410 [Alteribacillus persepolensis]|uniref:Uncharacterized protein n=1 Tax=Alteribacillus persepolensis TaxID=568899 RepID=A0A1G8IGR1_9BACI|nr:hypothetical protein [Alteribacillus persepolensis]SDI17931.1 hypothetical protein SAMN05192534_12410 [Alteribacillus persepolensis]
MNNDKKELSILMENSPDAIKAIEKVIEEHKNIDTVIVEPDSWTGKELLIQSKRLIDLCHEVREMKMSINRLNEKINSLTSDTEYRRTDNG